MDRAAPDARILVYAPGLHNTEVIARRLTAAGFVCLGCDTAERFEAHLEDDHLTLGAAVLTTLARRTRAGAALARFKESEPAWSALPIVLLAPPGEASATPWPHTTILSIPTTERHLVGTLDLALVARDQQQLVASASDDLRRAAYVDALTGLPNRSALYERIRALQTERRGADGAFAAVFVDLNHFKHINDSYGHGAGDDVLRLTAAHLVSIVRADDVVARWGGDEFMILLIGTVGSGVVSETMARLGEGMVASVRASPTPLTVSFSVGLVESIAPESTAEEILIDVDRRMYDHKNARRRVSDR